MSLWSRLHNVFRRHRLNDELDEELESHIREAIASGRDPEEVRRAFGNRLRIHEESADAKILGWLDSLRADAVFGWRQLAKNRLASGAAILSLALAIGASTGAFRIIDAVLLRPLPVADPDRLFYLVWENTDADGRKLPADTFDYPMFRAMGEAAKDHAELMAIGIAARVDLTFGGDDEIERAHRQFVSGNTFGVFGLRPALGRLLTPNDDRQPNAHPYAVISHDYWDRRFGRDPDVVGRKFRMGSKPYEIVGVVEKGFTGTDPGTLTDIFIPTMMNAAAINNSHWVWFRTWVRPNVGVAPEELRTRLHAVFRNTRIEEAKKFKEIFKERVDQFVNAPLALEPAGNGTSGLQYEFRLPLLVLAVLVGLVLLVACANVANLMTAQTSGRAREMALRVSIGAGRRRLIQLVLVEGALLATAASVLGGLFAWWSAPLVVSMLNPPNNPVRLILPMDWRFLGFSILLTVTVSLIFGLGPALRASGVRPSAALKGDSVHSRRRLMNALVGAQVAFCFLVHFVAGLFVASFDRLKHQPTGFVTESLLVIDAEAKGEPTAETWRQLATQLAELPGVESAAVSNWALMTGNAWTSGIVLPGRQTEEIVYKLTTAPGWFQTMRIEMLAGRDFRPDEMDPNVAIVNEAFARKYFSGENPVGRNVEILGPQYKRFPTQIVGLVSDTKYNNMREAAQPIVYAPLLSAFESQRTKATFLVRTTTDPLVMAPILRQEIPRLGSTFRASNIVTQQELVDRFTIRERLLALLSSFFAGVALVLAAVGLYGVLSYTVFQRRREIGIRMALGAQAGDIARRVGAETFGMLILGSAVGLAAGATSERFLASLLFAVNTTDLRMMLLPAGTILAVAAAASIAPLMRALRTDPSEALRVE